MTERNTFEIYQKKLQGICDENNLVGKFNCDGYPIKMTIQPCTDLDGQMTMLEEAGDNGNGYRSPDAVIIFYMEDGELCERVKGTFDIGDTLKTKLKTIFKKMHFLYLQFYHREIIEKKLAPVLRILPSKPIPDGATPIEEYEQESMPCDNTGPLPHNDPDVQAAVSLATANRFVSADMVAKELEVGIFKSTRIVLTLIEMGVVSETAVNGRHTIINWDEPEDDE